jgi:Sigma-54 interaction domain
VHLPGRTHVERRLDGDDTPDTTPAADFQRLVGVGSNMLVRGEKSAIAATVVALSVDLSLPLVTWNAGGDDGLPGLHDGTVVLQDVDRLDLSGQHELLAWLDDRQGRVRVISTSQRDLFDLVTAGEFLDPLYYRLNTIVVDVVPGDGLDTPH